MIEFIKESDSLYVLIYIQNKFVGTIWQYSDDLSMWLLDIIYQDKYFMIKNIKSYEEAKQKFKDYFKVEESFQQLTLF